MKHFHLNSAIVGAVVGVAILLVARPLTDASNPDVEALMAADRAFSAMSGSKGAKAAWGAFMTEDSMILGHGSQPLTGLDNILTGFDTWPEGASINWRPERAEVADSGDLGWTWGRYIYLAPGEDGAAVASHGKYLNIWEKQPDGTWKVSVDMGNLNPAPEEDQ